MKKNTKELILLEAFKLFSICTYEQVTFTELERKTELTRGAIMYYFKTKDLLFIEVCNKFLFRESSVLDKLEVKAKNVETLMDLIEAYISAIYDLKEYMNSLEINNYNKAYINVTLQATHYYPHFEAKAKKWQSMQINLWKKMIVIGIESNEIKKDIDQDTIANLFEDIYCGISYSGMIYPNGIDIDHLRKSFHYLYDSIKV